MKLNSFKFILFLSLSALFTSHAVAQSAPQNPYNLVGQKHNEYVRYVLTHMSSRPPVGSVVSTIEQLLKQVFECQEATSPTGLPETNLYQYLRQQVEAIHSNQLIQKVNQVEAFLDTNPTVAQVMSFISGLESTATSSVPSSEVLPYQFYLATIKYSAQLWLPVSMGGENGLALKSFNPVGGQTQAMGDPTQIIKADGFGVLKGAGASLIGSKGAAALPGPLGVPWAGWAGLFMGAACSIEKAID